MKPIGDREYRFIRDLVYERSSINLGDKKRELVTSRLAKRLRALKIATFEEYCHLLTTPKGEDELTGLIDAISTNHTYFLREPAHFEYLAREIIPGIIGNSRKSRRINLWSAACASGEEPYTIVFVMNQCLPQASGWSFQVDCSDISTRALRAAREAIFPEQRLDHLPAHAWRQFFDKGQGKWTGHYRIKNQYRTPLRLHQLNLLKDRYPFNDLFDVVFLRNVMIYFDKDTQTTLVNKIMPFIRPGGYLFIGHAESLNGLRHEYQYVKPAIYRRP